MLVGVERARLEFVIAGVNLFERVAGSQELFGGGPFLRTVGDRVAEPFLVCRHELLVLAGWRRANSARLFLVSCRHVFLNTHFFKYHFWYLFCT